MKRTEGAPGRQNGPAGSDGPSRVRHSLDPPLGDQTAAMSMAGFVVSEVISTVAMTVAEVKPYVLRSQCDSVVDDV
jgi:hypothetical protein